MSNLSINTQFIGFSENVNLAERKTIGLNAESEPYTLSDLSVSMGYEVLQPFDIVTNGAIDSISIYLNTVQSLSDQFSYSLVEGVNYIENIKYIEISNNDDNNTSDCTEITFNGLKNASIVYNNNDTLLPPIEVYNFPDLVYISYNIVFTDSVIKEFNAPLAVKHFIQYNQLSNSGIKFTECPLLESINMPLLEEGKFMFDSCYPSNGINLPSFKNAIGLYITNTTSTDTNLTSTNIPIEKLGAFVFNTVYGLESISFDTLKNAQLIYDNMLIFVVACNDIVSFSIPNVIEYKSVQDYTPLSYSNIRFASNPNLTSITLGTIGILKVAEKVSIDVDSCPLNQESVDGILALFASLDGTNGTTLSENGILGLGGMASAPSATGLANKAILQSRGWDVVTNS